MKHLYISICTLIFSLAFLYYAEQVRAESLSENQCNKSCGSVEACDIGYDWLQAGWTGCHIYESGECAVYGAYCSGGAGDPSVDPEP